MRRNNKGFTLVELVVVMAVMVAIMGSVTGIIAVSRNSYNNVSNDADLQYEAQTTMKQIENMVVDSTIGLTYGYTSEDDADGADPNKIVDDSQIADVNKVTAKNLIIYDENAKYDIAWNSSNNELTYTKSSVTYNSVEDKYESSVVASDVKFSDSVTGFSVAVDNSKSSPIVTLDMEFESGDMSYSITKNMSLRNSILVNQGEDAIYPDGGRNDVLVAVAKRMEIKDTSTGVVYLTDNTQGINHLVNGASNSRTFTAKVTGDGYPSQFVTWGLSGDVSEGTSVNESGVLTIGNNQSAGKLTLTATSLTTGTDGNPLQVSVDISIWKVSKIEVSAGNAYTEEDVICLSTTGETVDGYDDTFIANVFYAGPSTEIPGEYSNKNYSWQAVENCTIVTDSKGHQTITVPAFNENDASKNVFKLKAVSTDDSSIESDVIECRIEQMDLEVNVVEIAQTNTSGVAGELWRNGQVVLEARDGKGNALSSGTGTNDVTWTYTLNDASQNVNIHLDNNSGSTTQKKVRCDNNLPYNEAYTLTITATSNRNSKVSGSFEYTIPKAEILYKNKYGTESNNALIDMTNRSTSDWNWTYDRTWSNYYWDYIYTYYVTVPYQINGVITNSAATFNKTSGNGSFNTKDASASSFKIKQESSVSGVQVISATVNGNTISGTLRLRYAYNLIYDGEYYQVNNSTGNDLLTTNVLYKVINSSSMVIYDNNKDEYHYYTYSSGMWNENTNPNWSLTRWRCTSTTGKGTWSAMNFTYSDYTCNINTTTTNENGSNVPEHSNWRIYIYNYNSVRYLTLFDTDSNAYTYYKYDSYNEIWTTDSVGNDGKRYCYNTTSGKWYQFNIEYGNYRGRIEQNATTPDTGSELAGFVGCNYYKYTYNGYDFVALYDSSNGSTTYYYYYYSKWNTGSDAVYESEKIYYYSTSLSKWVKNNFSYSNYNCYIDKAVSADASGSNVPGKTEWKIYIYKIGEEFYLALYNTNGGKAYYKYSGDSWTTSGVGEDKKIYYYDTASSTWKKYNFTYSNSNYFVEPVVSGSTSGSNIQDHTNWKYYIYTVDGTYYLGLYNTDNRTHTYYKYDASKSEWTTAGVTDSNKVYFYNASDSKWVHKNFTYRTYTDYMANVASTSSAGSTIPGKNEWHYYIYTVDGTYYLAVYDNEPQHKNHTYYKYDGDSWSVTNDNSLYFYRNNVWVTNNFTYGGYSDYITDTNTTNKGVNVTGHTGWNYYIYSMNSVSYLTMYDNGNYAYYKYSSGRWTTDGVGTDGRLYKFSNNTWVKKNFNYGSYFDRIETTVSTNGTDKTITFSGSTWHYYVYKVNTTTYLTLYDNGNYTYYKYVTASDEWTTNSVSDHSYYYDNGTWKKYNFKYDSYSGNITNTVSSSDSGSTIPGHSDWHYFVYQVSADTTTITYLTLYDNGNYTYYKYLSSNEWTTEDVSDHSYYYNGSKWIKYNFTYGSYSGNIASTVSNNNSGSTITGHSDWHYYVYKVGTETFLALYDNGAYTYYKYVNNEWSTQEVDANKKIYLYIGSTWYKTNFTYDSYNGYIKTSNNKSTGTITGHSQWLYCTYKSNNRYYLVIYDSSKNATEKDKHSYYQYSSNSWSTISNMYDDTRNHYKYANNRWQ